ncbi:MAG TPA: RdgB/HAM1 family non-canonical purine NTP pyrophosphatase [Chitinophagaceae bacterium]
MELIFATNNQHKVEEINAVLPPHIHSISLKEAGIDVDIPEPHNTLEDNAREKARTIRSMTGKDCFSEDTGLEVAALNGAPGVQSARYAGDGRSFDRNIEKLLANLSGHQDRQARFRTVICLSLDGEEHLFEGICRGRIIDEKRGAQGFGYDPVFIPEGGDKTFAEMSLQEKSMFSHRKKAVDKLVVFLNNLKSKE